MMTISGFCYRLVVRVYRSSYSELRTQGVLKQLLMQSVEAA